MRQGLEDILFDNMKDCECNSDHLNHRNDSVFEKFSYKEMLKISCDEYPVQRRDAKKKNLREKIFALNVILNSVAPWSRGRPSVQIVQVRLSA